MISNPAGSLVASVLCAAEESLVRSERREGLVATRLLIAVVGLACAASSMILPGGPSWLDSVLAGAAATMVLAALLANRCETLTAARTASTAATCAFVFCLQAANGFFWPSLLWLLMEPVDEILSGGAGRKVSILISAAGATLLVTLAAMGWMPSANAVAGQFAAALLVFSALLQTLVRQLATRRSEAEARRSADLRQSEEASLLRAVGDLVTWHDRRGDVLRTTEAATRLLGVTPASLAGEGLFRRVHVPDRPAFLKALSDAANGTDPVSVEFRVHRAGEDEDTDAARSPARLMWVEMRAHPIAAASEGLGQGAAVVAFTRDASARKNHAEELETARLEAERANELKGRFLATVSHELRTPLNAIIGFSELLAADHPYVMSEDRRREYAAIIRNSGQHLLDVVNTLLDMSKIESGNFSLITEPFSLGELARGCRDLMGLKAEQAGVALDHSEAPGLPEIVADRRACRQILINLVSNALKFTPSGGRVAMRLTQDGGMLVLSVSDTGIGIGEADLPRLGNPFFQAGDLHRRPHEGTGLGLSVVRGLVGLHGGTMAIESAPGLGTTVTVELPIEPMTASAQARPVAVRISSRQPDALERRSA